MSVHVCLCVRTDTWGLCKCPALWVPPSTSEPLHGGLCVRGCLCGSRGPCVVRVGFCGDVCLCRKVWVGPQQSGSFLWKQRWLLTDNPAFFP